jgi:hypothetical protein
MFHAGFCDLGNFHPKFSRQNKITSVLLRFVKVSVLIGTNPIQIGIVLLFLAF